MYYYYIIFFLEYDLYMFTGVISIVFTYSLSFGYQLQGPLVLQVSKMRNVAAPKAFEESGGAPRMLKLSLSDGTNTLHGLELQNIKAIR